MLRHPRIMAIVAVEWERIDPQKAEDVMSMLLKNICPEAERIWGAGGDEGRDVQIRLADGSLHAFEIKGFTGRITDSRKRQIKRSLQRAAELSPVDWTLLMPIDPTPKEEAWLRSLQALVPFPTRWQGRLYLDTELAKRPWIDRYLLGDWADEVVRLLEQAGQERAALSRGALDAMERIERVASDLNELDPFYVWHVASDGNRTTISPRPRYRGAEIDYPLNVEIQFQFSDDSAGRRAAGELKRHLDFGTAVDVPAEYIERVSIDAPAFPQGELPPGASLSASPRPGRSAKFVVAVSAPDGTAKATVPVTGVVASSGQRGSILELQDVSGSLRVLLTLDFVDRKLTTNFRYEVGDAYYPAQLRPVMALLVEVAPPNRLQLRTADGHVAADQAIDETYSDTSHRRFLRLLDDLALIQWAARQYERVGVELGEIDLEEVWMATELIRGLQLRSTWRDATFTLSNDAPRETRQLWTKDGFRLAVSTQEPYVARIDGCEYRLGRGVVWEVDSATMAPEHEEWRVGGPPPGAQVRVVPKDSNVLRRWLLTEDRLHVFEQQEAEPG